jgi:hypothetical protein
MGVVEAYSLVDPLRLSLKRSSNNQLMAGNPLPGYCQLTGVKGDPKLPGMYNPGREEVREVKAHIVLVGS